jgi:hypothetical protein
MIEVLIDLRWYGSFVARVRDSSFFTCFLSIFSGVLIGIADSDHFYSFKTIEVEILKMCFFAHFLTSY